MTTCGKRARLTAHERQQINDRMSLMEANRRAVCASRQPTTDRVPCARCGKPLAVYDEHIGGLTVTCGTCYSPYRANDQVRDLLTRAAQVREHARRLRGRRQREQDYITSTLGVGGAATSFFRLYRPATDSQRQALDLARGFQGNPWCLVLAGGPGVGKSHLMGARFRQSVRTAVKNDYPLPAFATEHELAKRWRAGFREGPQGADAVLEEAMTARVLYVDDLGIVSATGEGWVKAMGQIIEYRERHRLATFITTNLGGGEIARIYGPRVASRLASGVHRVEGPDARLVNRAA